MTGRRVRVLRIIDRLNVGGPAIHAVLTTCELDRQRFEVTLVHGNVEPGEADMGYLLDGKDADAVVIPELGRELRPLRDLWTLWRLFRLMRTVRPDVVHTHKAKAGALGRVAALLAGVPVRVHTFHGHVFDGYFGPWKTRVFVTIERALARRTTRLVALSQTLVDELAGRYGIAPAARFAIVPLGFDLRPFAECAVHRGRLRRTLGLGPETFLIGIVGRMVPVKDHRTFIDAAALLAERRSDVHFVLVGGGELEQELRAHIERSGLAARTHLLGWRRELPAIYADLDAVALSSLNEGTPVTLIEAMASGVPVVATSVGGVRDVLHDGERGAVVPPRDPAALAHAMEQALAKGSRERAELFRGRVIEEYGGRRLCADLETLYDLLISQARGAALRPPAADPTASALGKAAT